MAWPAASSRPAKGPPNRYGLTHHQVVQQPVQSVEIVGYLPHGPAQVAEVDGLERQHHRLPTLLDGVAKREGHRIRCRHLLDAGFHGVVSTAVVSSFARRLNDRAHLRPEVR